MRWLSRLMMTPTQRNLTDPAAFGEKVSRSEVLAGIQSECKGYDHERLAWMQRSAKEIGSGPTLTIAQVERSRDASKAARDRGYDRAYGEFPILSALGDDALLQFMVARANRLAEGIQPGAKAMLSDAF